MKLFFNIKRIGKAPAALLLAVLLLSGCEPSQHSSSGHSGSFSDTHSESTYSSSSSEDHSSSSSSVSVSDSGSDGPGSQSTDSGQSGSSSTESTSDNSTSQSSTSENSSDSWPSNSSSSSSSQASSTSSTPIVPKPPETVVIPDFEVPTSPGAYVESAASGWVDYTNASKGYISAKYTGGRPRSKLRIAANGEDPYTFDLSVGVVEYFPLSFGSGTYTVILYEQIDGASGYSTVLRFETEVNISNPRSPFSYSNRYVYYTKDSDCVYKAAELCAGKTDNISKIAAIFTWVTDNISYDNQLAATVKGNTAYCPDPDRTMLLKTGICYDYASLMAAMLRSQGIPTRLVIGYAGSTRHAWNEIYTEQTGWITPELFLANNGYNIADATFYSGASNKKQIADYISNKANYSAVYYY